MSAALTTLRAAGITLATDGDTLVARPRAALTDELRGLIRDNKGVLMEELRQPWTPPNDIAQQQATTKVELPGVSSEFQARLDAEDRVDIAAGDIPAETVRAALADYPVLVPDRPGRVDTLSLGLARLAVLIRTSAWCGKGSSAGSRR